MKSAYERCQAKLEELAGHAQINQVRLAREAAEHFAAEADLVGSQLEAAREELESARQELAEARAAASRFAGKGATDTAAAAAPGAST